MVTVDRLYSPRYRRNDIINELKIFENDKFGELTVLYSEKHGPLFVGHEVASMAGYKAPKDAIRNLRDKYKVKFSYDEAKELFLESKILDSEINHNGLTFVNKPGVYKLASGKNETFEDWIFFDVLDSIDKTGKFELDRQVEMLDAVELESLVNKCEELKLAKAPELANINKQSARMKLNTLITTLSHERQIGTKALYEQLYYRYAEQTGTFIPVEAKNSNKTSKEYMKTHAILAERLYEFALIFFYQGKSVLELFSLDKQTALTSF